MTNRQPDADVYGALFGPLPQGWRERKGLPAAPGATAARGTAQGATAAGGGGDAETLDAKTLDANAAPPPRIPGARAIAAPENRATLPFVRMSLKGSSCRCCADR